VPNVEWSAATLHEFHRHPEAHPRRAVEWGRIFGSGFAAHHLQGGIVPAQRLEEEWGSVLADSPPPSPEIRDVVPHWRSLFMLWTIRMHFGRRYGSVAVGGFDAGADEKHRQLVPDAGRHVPSKEPCVPPQAELSWWFGRYDHMLELVRQNGWLADTPRAQPAMAFIWLMMGTAYEGPVKCDTTHPRFQIWSAELALHIGWTQEVAVAEGRRVVKEMIEVLEIESRSGEDA
jgi:hypothetical protein